MYFDSLRQNNCAVSDSFLFYNQALAGYWKKRQVRLV